MRMLRRPSGSHRMPLCHDARRHAGGRVLAAGSARCSQGLQRGDPHGLGSPALPVEDLLAQVGAGQDVLDQTAVTATGRFLDEPGLLVEPHLRHRAGLWFVAPLELDDGRIVLVSRGWIPRDVAAGQNQQQIEAVDGRVTVTGRLFASVDGGRLGSPVNGVPQVSRLDLDTAQDAIGLEVVDRWVQAEDPDWRRGVIPIPVPPARRRATPFLCLPVVLLLGVDRDRLRIDPAAPTGRRGNPTKRPVSDLGLLDVGGTAPKPRARPQ